MPSPNNPPPSTFFSHSSNSLLHDNILSNTSGHLICVKVINQFSEGNSQSAELLSDNEGQHLGQATENCHILHDHQAHGKSKNPFSQHGLRANDLELEMKATDPPSNIPSNESYPPASPSRGVGLPRQNQEMYNLLNAMDSSPWSSTNSSVVSLIPESESEFSPSETSHCSSSGELYVKSMLPLRYGYPLAMPQPNDSLPIIKRRIGTTIGDVGIIREDGSFDYLFNPLLPTTDPRNPPDLPLAWDDFLPPVAKTSAIRSAFNSKTAVCSTGIDCTTDRASMELSISHFSDNGNALLFLPDGACQENLINSGEIKEFVIKHAETWISYAIRTGRDIDRNSLYFVTGCTKGADWGIATFNPSMPWKTSSLKLGKSTDVNDPRYIWEWSRGCGMARTGPGPDEELNNELVDVPQNQSLFIKGYKIALSEKAWTRILAESRGTLAVNAGQSMNASTSDFNPGSGQTSGGSHGYAPSGSSATYNTPGCSGTNIEPFPIFNKLFHPSDTINRILLEKIPEAEMAIAHDDEWCEITKGYGSIDSKLLVQLLGSKYCASYCEGAAVLSTTQDAVSAVDKIRDACFTFAAAATPFKTPGLGVTSEPKAVNKIRDACFKFVAAATPFKTSGLGVTFKSKLQPIIRCTWKHPSRKPRTEQHFEALHKRPENLCVRMDELPHLLETQMDLFLDQHNYPILDSRPSKPPETEGESGTSAGFVSGNSRRRGTFNTACDVCSRKKIKCDGKKSTCSACQLQGREKDCTWNEYPDRKARTNESLKVAGRFAQLLLKKLPDCVNTNPVKMALSIVKATIEIQDAVGDNKDGLAQGLREAEAILQTVEKTVAMSVPEAVEQEIVEFKQKIEDETKNLKELARKLLVAQILDYEEYKNRTRQIFRRINEATMFLQLAMVSNIQVKASQIHDDIKKAALERLRPSEKADHKTVFEEQGLKREECMPGTRVKVLEDLTNWANDHSPCVFWLTGLGGSGKTTIAKMFELFEKDANSNQQTVLGGNFPCPRQFQETQALTGILSTIVYQLARKCKFYANALHVADKFTQIVSGSYDESVRVWDVLTGAKLNLLKGHTNWVNSVAFSSDGMQIVSGSRDQSVRVWDALTGAELNVLKGHTNWVNSVAFSSDGMQIVSGSRDQSVRVWDALTGAELNVLKGHTGSGDALTGAELNVLKGHAGSVCSVAVLSDTIRISPTITIWPVGKPAASSSATEPGRAPISINSPPQSGPSFLPEQFELHNGGSSPIFPNVFPSSLDFNSYLPHYTFNKPQEESPLTGASHVFAGEESLSDHTISPTQSTSYPGNELSELSGILGMLGGQTLSSSPFVAFSVGDTATGLSDMSPENTFPSFPNLQFGKGFKFLDQSSSSYLSRSEVGDDDINMEDCSETWELWAQCAAQS